MKTKLLGVVAALAVASVIIFGSVRAFAITIETGNNIISSPTYFNGFEGYTGAPTTSYSEGGITVSFSGNSASLLPIGSYPYWDGMGQYQWYVPIAGYSTIKLTNGGNFQSLQFLASSGWREITSSFLTYMVLEQGSFVASGTVKLNTVCCPIGLAGGTWEYIGFSGGGFDEVRLQDFSTFDNFNPTAMQALALDNISAVSEVPLPAALPLFATGWAR